MSLTPAMEESERLTREEVRRTGCFVEQVVHSRPKSDGSWGMLVRHRSFDGTHWETLFKCFPSGGRQEVFCRPNTKPDGTLENRDD